MDWQRSHLSSPESGCLCLYVGCLGLDPAADTAAVEAAEVEAAEVEAAEVEAAEVEAAEMEAPEMEAAGKAVGMESALAVVEVVEEIEDMESGSDSCHWELAVVDSLAEGSLGRAHPAPEDGIGHLLEEESGGRGSAPAAIEIVVGVVAGQQPSAL